MVYVRERKEMLREYKKRLLNTLLLHPLTHPPTPLIPYASPACVKERKSMQVREMFMSRVHVFEVGSEDLQVCLIE